MSAIGMPFTIPSEHRHTAPPSDAYAKDEPGRGATRAEIGTAAAILLVAAGLGLGTALGFDVFGTRDVGCPGSDSAAFHCRNTWIATLKSSQR